MNSPSASGTTYAHWTGPIRTNTTAAAPLANAASVFLAAFTSWNGRSMIVDSTAIDRMPPAAPKYPR